MINEYDLLNLCKKYKLNASHIITKNKRVLTVGEYQKMAEILDYLTNTLKIKAKYIEKCPSILYHNLDYIKANYEFLISTNLGKNNIKSCLHILNTNPQKLEKTYNYLLTNFFFESISIKTTIL